MVTPKRILVIADSNPKTMLIEKLIQAVEEKTGEKIVAAHVPKKKPNSPTP